MHQVERRRHVRVRPIPELPLRAAMVGAGPISDALQVVDVSVGGLALSAEGSLLSLSPGQELSVRLTLAQFGEHQVKAVLRWRGPMQAGVEFTDLSPDQATAIRRYVAELLERGAHS